MKEVMGGAGVDELCQRQLCEICRENSQEETPGNGNNQETLESSRS